MSFFIDIIKGLRYRNSKSKMIQYRGCYAPICVSYEYHIS